MSQYKRSKLLKFLVLIIGYAVVMAAYAMYTSPNQVPAVYTGTPGDPATFFTPAQLEDSETLNAIRNWVFFMSGPWEWLIYLFLLSGGLARYWRDAPRADEASDLYSISDLRAASGGCIVSALFTSAYYRLQYIQGLRDIDAACTGLDER